MSNSHTQLDFFERIRRVVVAVMLAAGAAAVLGSVLDWVTITRRPGLVEGFDFQESNSTVEAPEVTEPFNGIEATYGVYSVVGGALLMTAALLLLTRRRGRYAWLGFVAAMVVGAIAVAAYRGIADSTSDLSQRMDIVGKAEPAIGVFLVGAGGVVGLIASGLGVAATPHSRPESETLEP